MALTKTPQEVFQGSPVDPDYQPIAAEAVTLIEEMMALLDVDGIVTMGAAVIGGIRVTIADDAVTTVTPPRDGGFAHISVGATQAFPQKNGSGIIYFQIGGTLVCEKNTGFATVGALLTASLATLTGTTGTDTHLTVSAITGGLMVENRTGASRVVTIIFT